jgi:hypothetical protein
MTTRRRLFIGTLVGALVIAFVTFLVIRDQTRTKLQALRQQGDHLSNLASVAEESKGLPTERWNIPRLAAPSVQTFSPPAESSLQDGQSNNVMARRWRGDAFPPKVDFHQLDAYLNENWRNAATLLASSRVAKDKELLREAMGKYPDDPQVAFSALFRADASPEERRHWLESFKQSAPDNALANYLSAREFFKGGQVHEAVQELNVASSKGEFQDYFLDFSQNEEAAWSAAGYSTAEAKVFSAWSLGYPHLGDLRELARDISSLYDSYQQAGDESSAQAALQTILNLSMRLGESPGQPYPSRKVSLDIEKIGLGAMDPTSSYGGTGETVSDLLNELTQQRELLEEMEEQADQNSFRQKVSDEDWIAYKDRWIASGEETALQWLVGKYGSR